jgi:hypothetical protein
MKNIDEEYTTTSLQIYLPRPWSWVEAKGNHKEIHAKETKCSVAVKLNTPPCFNGAQSIKDKINGAQNIKDKPQSRNICMYQLPLDLDVPAKNVSLDLTWAGSICFYWLTLCKTIVPIFFADW